METCSGIGNRDININYPQSEIVLYKFYLLRVLRIRISFLL